MDTGTPDTRVLTAALEEACRALRAAERALALAVSRRSDVEKEDDRVRLCRVMLHSACVVFVQRMSGPQTMHKLEPGD